MDELHEAQAYLIETAIAHVQARGDERCTTELNLRRAVQRFLAARQEVAA